MELNRRLRKHWLLTLLTILICGAVGYWMQPVEVHFDSNQFWMKTIFLILILVLIPASSIYHNRSIKRLREAELSVRENQYERGFKFRMIVLAFLGISGSAIMLFSGDSAYPKIIGLLLILLVVGYPSKGFVERDMKKE
jgi:uncharacterized membrane protein YhaH (DUF805 family)